MFRLIQAKPLATVFPEAKKFMPHFTSRLVNPNLIDVELATIDVLAKVRQFQAVISSVLYPFNQLE